MAGTSGLQGIENFDLKGQPSVVAARWEQWRKSFVIYVAASGKDLTEGRKIALILHCAGCELQCVFETFDMFPQGVTSETSTYEQATTALNTYFQVQRNDSYERNIFRNLKQFEGEAVSCNDGPLQSCIRMVQSAQSDTWFSQLWNAVQYLALVAFL